MERAKGGRGERIAVSLLRMLFPDVARDLNDVYAKNGIDLIGTGALDVQVKHYRKHVSLSKLDEIRRNYDGRIPVLMSLPTHLRGSMKMVALFATDLARILDDVGTVYQVMGDDAGCGFDLFQDLLQGRHGLNFAVYTHKNHVWFTKYDEMYHFDNKISIVASCPKTASPSDYKVMLSVADFLRILDDVGVVH